MRVIFIIVFINTLLLIKLYAQEPKSYPAITLKASFYISAIYGKDYRPYTLDNSIFFQPTFSGGIVVKNWIYLGLFISKYMWFVYDGAHGHERSVLGGEIGYPINGKYIIGLTIGKEKFYAPWVGMLPATYRYESPLYGLFFDYRIMKYLSIPLKIS